MFDSFELKFLPVLYFDSLYVVFFSNCDVSRSPWWQNWRPIIKRFQVNWEAFFMYVYEPVWFSLNTIHYVSQIYFRPKWKLALKRCWLKMGVSSPPSSSSFCNLQCLFASRHQDSVECFSWVLVSAVRRPEQAPVKVQLYPLTSELIFLCWTHES